VGLEPRESVTLDVIMALIHPADRARVQAAVSAAASITGPLPELEFRIVRRADGAARWLLSRGEVIADEHGRPVRQIGVMRDITSNKEAIERLALLARELDYRVKNTLAVVQAALRLTPKDDPAAYAEAVEGRVAALARAHTLLAEGRWEGAGLRALLEAELAPFLPVDPEADVSELPRAALDGPPLTLAPGAAQALSMALHELATNATKYGALSVRGGRVAVAWDADRGAGRLHLRWAEAGGPPVEGPPSRRGFGSRVVEATVRDQLGGKVERRWETAGLVCDIEAPLGRAVVGGEPVLGVRAQSRCTPPFVATTVS
jgi:PAS domain S-box-containing protein